MQATFLYGLILIFIDTKNPDQMVGNVCTMVDPKGLEPLAH